jgi:PAS domain S-box-containing protein
MRGLLFILAVLSTIFMGVLVFLSLNARGEVRTQAGESGIDLLEPLLDLDALVFEYLEQPRRQTTLTEQEKIVARQNFLNDLRHFTNRITTAPEYGFLWDDPQSGAPLDDINRLLTNYLATADANPKDVFGALTGGGDAPLLVSLHSALRTRIAEVSAQRQHMHQNRIASLTGYVTYLILGLAGLTSVVLGSFVVLYRTSKRLAQDETDLRARLEAVVTTSQDAVIVTDGAGLIVHFNDAAERLFDQPHGKLMACSAIDILAETEERENLLSRMIALGDLAADSRKPQNDRFVATGLRGDGRMFPAEVSTSVSRSTEGLIFMNFVRDVSERMQAEEKLKAARDRAMLGEKAKSNFLAVMSHEIRTPLNGLLGAVSLLQDTKLDAQQAGYLDNMITSGHLLREQVDDVLEITRFEAGREAQIVDVNIEDLVAEVVRNQVDLAALHGNKVSWQWVSDPEPQIRTDPRLLRQVLINLVGNGVKFTDRGTVTLKLERVEHMRKAMIELSVCDTGAGIAIDDQRRIFRDFERVDSSLTRRNNGTGLGLGIASRIVETLGGEIGVSSELGRGSRFWFRIPFVPASAPVPLQPIMRQHQSQPRSITPARVLLIEDNPINRQVLSQMLLADGHTVEQAENGMQAVALAAAQQFDLILIDVSMPVMDGPTAISEIREFEGPNQHTDIVVVTAHVMLHEYARVRGVGAQGYLKKPIDREELRTVMSGEYTWPIGMEMPPVTTQSVQIDAEQLENLLDALGAEKLSALLQRFSMEGDDLNERLARKTHDEAIVALVHRFAGSAAVIGAADLHATLGQFETCAHQFGAVAAVATYGVQLQASLMSTREALNDWMHA